MADRDINIGVTGFDALEQHLISGGELLRQNRVEQARKELEAALEIDSDNMKVLGLLGLACFRMDDFESALPVYKKLVSLERNDASFSLNLGLVYLKLGDPVAAIQELERSRELDPSQGRAVSYLGLAYARNGQYEEAYQAFLQAGVSELAREMEQYLSEEQRQAIRDSIGAQSGVMATPPPRPQAAETPAQEDEENDASDQAVEAETPVKTAAQSGADQPPSAQAVELDLDYDDVELISEQEVDAAPAQTGSAGAEQVEDIEEIDDVDELIEDARDGAAEDIPEFVLEEQIEVRGTPKASAGSENRAGGSARAATPPAVPDRQRPGVISQAVERATPSAAATAGAARVAVGHKPPLSLTEFATARLIRPEDGDHVFETSVGGVLIIRVKGKVFARTEGVSVTGGELAYEVASRHARGSSTGEDFSGDGRQLFIVSGHGHLIASPLGQHFTAVTLDEDILYLREELVFAFEEKLRWENGHVPGSRGTLGMVQFRGQGSVAFRTKRPLLAIKLAPERVLFVDAEALAGWVGRVMPRAVAPAAGGEKSTLFVECTGEGVVLVEEDETEVVRASTVGTGDGTGDGESINPASDSSSSSGGP